MTASELFALKTLNLFRTYATDKLEVPFLFHEIANKGDFLDIEYSKIQECFIELANKGYITYEGKPSSGIKSFTILDKGKRYIAELTNKEADEEAEKLETNQDKILIKSLNKSTFEANLSLIKTNESIRTLNEKTGSIYVFQKRSMYVTIVVACLAIFVPARQHFLDAQRDIRRDSVEHIYNLQLQRLEVKILQLDSVAKGLRSKTTQKADTATSKQLK